MPSLTSPAAATRPQRREQARSADTGTLRQRPDQQSQPEQSDGADSGCLALSALAAWDAAEQEPAATFGSRESGLRGFQPSEQEWCEQLRDGPVSWPPQPAPDVEIRREQLAAAVRDMRGEERDVTDRERFDAVMQQHVQPEKDMRGGQWSRYLPVWRDLAKLWPRCEEFQWALRTLQHGFQADWCEPEHPQKQREPKHERKMAGARRILRGAGFDARQVEAAMGDSRPPSYEAGNRFAVPRDGEFSREAIAKAVDAGVAIPWPEVWRRRGRRPWCVSPLARAVNSAGKERLILDKRVVNAFSQYHQFWYERIAELVTAAQPGSWLTLRDLRAGYHHAFVAPAMWSHLGVCVDGKYYVFVCLPFGLSQAPWAFTRLLQCIYRLPRGFGWPVTGMVDDSARLSATQRQAAWRSLCTARQESALGSVINLAKSESFPVREGIFLGLLVDAERGWLAAPQAKLQRLRGELRHLAQDWDERRALAACGFLASLAPGLRLAALLGRWLRQLVAGEVHARRSELRRLLAFAEAHLDQLNGRPWRLDEQPAVQVQLVTDASDRAVGAHLRGGDWRAELPFTAEEGEMSSTKREARGVLRGLQELERARPGLLTGKHVQCWTDSQSAACALANLSGGPSVFEEVKAVYELAGRLGAVLSFVWQPREHGDLVLADALSKLQDEGDWALSRTMAEQQLFGRMGRPDIDVFASRRAHQRCVAYYAAQWDGQCAAVDGLAQDWRQWPEQEKSSNTGRQPLCFVFPPLRLLMPALSKILAERVEAIVVHPRLLGPGPAALLAKLRPQVTCSVQLQGPHAHMIRPTPAVPRAAQEGGWKVAMCAVRVSWGRAQLSSS